MSRFGMLAMVVTAEQVAMLMPHNPRQARSKQPAMRTMVFLPIAEAVKLAMAAARLRHLPVAPVDILQMAAMSRLISTAQSQLTARMPMVSML